MIRNVNKIFGEPNDPNTILVNDLFEGDEILLGTGNKGIKALLPNTYSLLITDGVGNVTILPLNATNKIIGTNHLGEIVLIDREV